MIAVLFPFMVFALIPVIGVELLVARGMLKLGLRRAARAVVIANLASTLLGFPLLWILLAAFEISAGIAGLEPGVRRLGDFWSRAYSVTVGAPWLPPDEKNLHWMMPVAAAYLLIPAFFASVYLERWICGLFWREQERSRVRTFSWAAHIASYSTILVITVIGAASDRRVRHGAILFSTSYHIGYFGAALIVVPVCALMGKYATEWIAGFEPRYAKALIPTVLAFIGTSVAWLAVHIMGGAGAPWNSIYALLGCGLLTCSNTFLLKSGAGNPPGVGKSSIIAVCQVVGASISFWFLQSCFVLGGHPLI